ncbi:MAG: aminotransferase class IV, partial [Faecousia sp.]
MEINRMLEPDEGYYFGLGAFETVAVEEGRPVMLKEHYARLFRAMEFFCIKISTDELEEKVGNALAAPGMKTGRWVLKIAASKKNILVTTRKNTYSECDYERGFTADFSHVRRNETSPLTYHKTLNYGDCLLEKRRAHCRGIDEPIFLNTKGAIAEGATTNVFFVKNDRIYTPTVSSGILPGIMRAYICESDRVQETELYPQELTQFEEMFLTNSLLGVMPVVSLGSHRFLSQNIGRGLLAKYRAFCEQS